MFIFLKGLFYFLVFTISFFVKTFLYSTSVKVLLNSCIYNVKLLIT